MSAGLSTELEETLAESLAGMRKAAQLVAYDRHVDLEALLPKARVDAHMLAPAVAPVVEKAVRDALAGGQR